MTLRGYPHITSYRIQISRYFPTLEQTFEREEVSMQYGLRFEKIKVLLYRYYWE